MAKLNLSKLIAQKNALEKQIADAQRMHRGEAIARVKAMMAEFGVTMADLGGASGSTSAAPASSTASAGSGNNSSSISSKSVPQKVAKRAGAAAGKKVAAKYRNAATGDTWSGRGLKPRWLTAALASGRNISDFTI